MGVYERQVLPRMVELTCGGSEMARWRRRTVEGLHGSIVELGFGSGLNAELYPDEVDQVFAVEPNLVARQRSQRHTDGASARIEFVGLDGAALPLGTDSCDGALVTFTLCTIPDVDRALAELRRVLRPGGALHFLEHGRSPDAKVHTWQRRIEPVQQRLGGGCHLTREPATMIRDAGFDLVEIEERYVKGPKPWCWFSLGRAINPD